MDQIETVNEEGKYRTKEDWLIRKVSNENKNKNAEENRLEWKLVVTFLLDFHRL
jgi:hypothetical protein